MNRDTLVKLEERGLLLEQPVETYSLLIQQWQFPLYDLDLSEIKVSLESLRDRQRNWCPEW